MNINSHNAGLAFKSVYYSVWPRNCMDKYTQQHKIKNERYERSPEPKFTLWGHKPEERRNFRVYIDGKTAEKLVEPHKKTDETNTKACLANLALDEAKNEHKKAMEELHKAEDAILAKHGLVRELNYDYFLDADYPKI